MFYDCDVHVTIVCHCVYVCVLHVVVCYLSFLLCVVMVCVVVLCVVMLRNGMYCDAMLYSDM